MCAPLGLRCETQCYFFVICFVMTSKCWEDACFMLGHQKTFAEWWMTLLQQLVGSLVYTMCFKPIPKSVNSVQSLRCVWLFATPWIAACQASQFITISRSSLRLTSMESVMPSSPSHPLSSPSPPALNPSQHQSLFQWVNSSHEVAKVLEFQL